jgi:membrane-associated protease RseP (regulator of RpoE activity)
MDFINNIGGWVFLLIGLAISIALHEIGHLWPAKKFGVKVTKYMVGFGPTLFSRKRGDTEYGIKLIPLGGYIQMVGMLPPTQEATVKKNWWQRLTSGAQPTEQIVIAEEDKGKTFYELAPWKKLIIMFGGPFANLLIAAVLAVVLFSGFGAYERTSTVKDVLSCVPSQSNQDCADPNPASPSSKAGLLPGDQILSFAGQPVENWSDVEAELKNSVGKTVSLVVERSGVELTLSIEPVLLKEGESSRPYLGVYLETVRAPKDAIYALGQVGVMLSDTASMIIQLPLQAGAALTEIAPGSERSENGAISIVGLGQFSGQIASNDQISFEDKMLSQLGLLMSLNVALFVFNMVPLVPLDGGHIAGAVYESIKRGVFRVRGKKWVRPVDTSQMMPIAYFVASLLIVLTIVLVLRDILNPLSM